MTTKLWQTAHSSVLHATVESYTVGDDYMLDQELLGYDIEASKAHATMLSHVDLISPLEASEINQSLDILYKKWKKGQFRIASNQEDGHTAIETYLIQELGDTGKKIHTGRSRNDQALAMMRLFMKTNLCAIDDHVYNTILALKKKAKEAHDTPMPGYTHMQKAMPTTVASWLLSYAVAFADIRVLLKATLHIIDQNPLGSAAGFGTDLAIDRIHTTNALGFKKVQSNPMYCGLSRGFFELLCVQVLNAYMTLAGKLAQDMMLFTTAEFNFFSLPSTFTTGSSIMPHKHNYDLFEIMRGNAHKFGAYAQQLQSIVGGVGCGYHRDLQLTKSIVLTAFKTTFSTFEIIELTARHLVIHHDVLCGAITVEMLSVAKMDQLVKEGVPLRDAYSIVKRTLVES